MKLLFNVKSSAGSAAQLWYTKQHHLRGIDPMPDSGSNAQERQHDFDIQKDLHRKIRNDPDYDDWEYGTEPLPHENWKRSSGSSDEESAATPTD